MSLLTNLISYWKMDAVSGNEPDATATGNTLNDNGGVGSAAGIIGTSRTPTGNSKNFSHVDNASLSMSGDFTWQAWVYLSDLSTDDSYAVSKWASASGVTTLEYLLRFNHSNSRFEMIVGNGTSIDIAVANSFGTPSTSTWYLLHGWFDSVNNLVGIAVNAGTADTHAHTGVLDGTANLRVGMADDVGNGAYFGSVDEIGLWTRVLSSSERTQLYNGGAGLAYPLTVSSGGPFPWFLDQPHSGGFWDGGL